MWQAEAFALSTQPVIDGAEDKSDLVECREALLAVQTIASEQYGKNAGAVTFDSTLLTEVNTLAGFNTTGSTGPIVTAATTDAKAKVATITFTATSGKTWGYAITAGKGAWTKSA